MAAKKELSREEVSVRIGCSIGTVMKFEREKKLNPRREKPTGHCRVWFDAEEVEKVAREYKPTRKQIAKLDERLVESNIRGKIAAKVLPMFAEGITDLAKLCAATDADPMIIVQLYELWKLGPEGILRRKEREKQLAKEEAELKEQQRRKHDEKRQERWCQMRVEVAKLEAAKKSVLLPKLDMRPGDKEKKTG